MDDRNDAGAANGGAAKGQDGKTVGEVRLSAHSRRRAQMVRVGPGGWTRARRQAFLDALAETCNVTMATAAAGMRGKSAYDLRKVDPVFAGLWQEALALGYERLETALLRHALVGVNALEIGGQPERAEIPAALPEAREENVPPPAERRRHAVPGSGIVGDSPTPVQVQVALAMLNRRDAAERRGGVPRGLRKATLAEAEAALTERLDALGRQLAKSARPPAGRSRGSDPA